MNHFMIELKTRLEDAQKRYAEATQHLQSAQAHHVAIGQEVGSLQFLYQKELRKEQGNASPAQPQGADVITAHVSTTIQSAGRGALLPENAVPERAEVNKTEIVREILQQHPNGMTPTDLWKSLSGQITYRAYLYSILKRLKDKGDVFQKRGSKKYFPKMMPKSEEGKESHAMIQ
jgi:hypothetical protein